VSGSVACESEMAEGFVLPCVLIYFLLHSERCSHFTFVIILFPIIRIPPTPPHCFHHHSQPRYAHSDFAHSITSDLQPDERSEL